MVALKVHDCVLPLPPFTPFPSNKTVTFHSNGTITSTGTLCEYAGQQTGTGSSSTYSASTGVIAGPNCNHPYDINTDLSFEQLGNCVIIVYPGFPTVEAKYQPQ